MVAVVSEYSPEMKAVKALSEPPGHPELFIPAVLESFITQLDFQTSPFQESTFKSDLTSEMKDASGLNFTPADIREPH